MTAVTVSVSLNEDVATTIATNITTAIDSLNINASDLLVVTQKGSVAWYTKVPL